MASYLVTGLSLDTLSGLPIASPTGPWRHPTTNLGGLS